MKQKTDDIVFRSPRWFLIRHKPTGQQWRVSHTSASMACHLLKIRHDECIVVVQGKAEAEGKILQYALHDSNGEVFYNLPGRNQSDKAHLS